MLQQTFAKYLPAPYQNDQNMLRHVAVQLLQTENESAQLTQSRLTEAYGTPLKPTTANNCIE